MNNFKRWLLVLFAVLLSAFNVYADSAKQVDFLLSGYDDPTSHRPLSGGKVWTFLDGTSTLAPVWTDKDKGGVATNPVILDSSGKAEIYGDNIYKFVIYDDDDVLIEEINGLEYTVTFGVVVTKIDTIADLRTHTGYTGESVQVLGYYTPGDGGGGPTRIWKTGGSYTDNGGSVITPGGVPGPDAWLFADQKENFNAREFGARADGTTDDTNILQALLDYAASVSVPVYLPTGNYLISDELILQSNTTVFGDGDTTEISVVPGWTYKEDVFRAVSVDSVSIRKIKFNLDSIAQGTIFLGVTRGLIEDCLFVNSPPFISTTCHVDDSSTDIRIKGNRYDSCGNYAVSVNDSKRVAVSDNVSWGLRGRIGLNSGAEECSASNNTIIVEGELDVAPGMSVEGINCTVVGNTITKAAGSPWTETGDEGIGLNGSAIGNTLTSNTITGFRMGVRCSSGATGTVATANTIADCKYGIGAELGAFDATITANTIKSCESAGILAVFNSVDITGNTILDCGIGIEVSGNNRFYSILGNTIRRSAKESITINTGSIQAGSILNNKFIDTGEDATVDGQYYAIAGIAMYKTTVSYNKVIKADATYRVDGLVEITAGADNIVSNNDILAATTGDKVLATPAQAAVYTNKGWRSENSGTATILSGNTSITVAHGCDRVPELKSLSITSLDSMGAAIKSWVTLSGSTSIVIHVDQNPGVDIDFSWAVLPIGS